MMDRDRQARTGQDAQTLATKLHRLLDEQLTAGREGNLSRVEQLGEQANAVVEEIVQQGDEMSAVLGAHRRSLERSYGELILMLRAQQADVQGRLRQLRRVKRAVGAYRIDY